MPSHEDTEEHHNDNTKPLITLHNNHNADSSLNLSGDSECPCSFSFEYEPSPVNPPDGGYGWVIVGAAFFINLIADGISFSFGVLLTELFDNLPGNHEEIAIIGALLQGMPLILGPLTSILIDRFGCRLVTMAGAVVSSLGFAVASFMPAQVFLVSLTAGLLSGIGLSMCFMPAVVIVSFYFSKRRSFATGISVSGTGVGTCLFAPLISYLIKEFSWRGTFLIMGGVMLNMCICGALYRPLEPDDLEEKRKMRKMFKKFLKDSPNIREEFAKENMNGTFKDSRQSKSLLCIPTYLNEDVFQIDHLNHSTSTEKIPPSEDYKIKVNDLKKVNSCTGRVSTHNQTTSVIKAKKSNLKRSRRGADHNFSNDTSHMQVELFPLSLEKWNSAAAPRRMRKSTLIDSQDVVSSYSLRRQLFPVDRRFFMLNYVRMATERAPEFESCPEIRHQQVTSGAHNSAQKVLYQRVVKNVCSLKVIKDMKFLFSSWPYILFWISNFVLYFWYDITYMFLPDHAEDLGIDTFHSSMIMAVIGIVNTVGQIVIGFIGDDPRINSITLYIVCLTLVGIANALVPFCLTLWSLMVYGIVYGFLISANYSLCSIVIVDLFSLEKLTTGYGFMMLGQGIANLFGGPVIGRMKDVHNDYYLAYVYSGVFVIISNLILVPIWVYNNCLLKKQRAEERLPAIEEEPISI